MSNIYNDMVKGGQRHCERPAARTALGFLIELMEVRLSQINGHTSEFLTKFWAAYRLGLMRFLVRALFSIGEQ
jgi:hypothetical protein